ncbi:hypothetical protein Tco_0032355 [Tanacetum coccineum]
MAESAKRHEENSNIIKEIRAFTNTDIRNQGASIKTLEIQIGQTSKVLQERGIGGLSGSTEPNPRDHVKSISTAKADSSEIRRMGCVHSKAQEDVKILKAYDHTCPLGKKRTGKLSLPCLKEINDMNSNSYLRDILGDILGKDMNKIMKMIKQGTAPETPTTMIPQTTAISNIKLPILKKEEYDIWAMEMEHYLEYIDNEVWKVIQNGNSKKRISVGYRDFMEWMMQKRSGKPSEQGLVVMLIQRKCKRLFFKQQFEAFKISNSEGLEKGYGQGLTVYFSQLEAHGDESVFEPRNSSAYSSCTPFFFNKNVPEKGSSCWLLLDEISEEMGHQLANKQMDCYSNEEVFKKTGWRVEECTAKGSYDERRSKGLLFNIKKEAGKQEEELDGFADNGCDCHWGEHTEAERIKSFALMDYHAQAMRSVQLNACRPKVNSVRPNLNTGRTNISSGRSKVNYVSPKVNSVSPKVNSVGTTSNNVNTDRLDHDDSLMPELEIFHKPETGIFDEASYDDEGVITDFNSLPTEIEVSPTPTLRIHSIHPKSQILGDPKSAVQTRSKVQNKSGAHALLCHTQKQQRNNHKDQQHCLFACFLSQEEPKKIAEALQDDSLGFKLCKKNCYNSSYNNVWVLVHLPHGNEGDGIDYDKVFAPVARVEAIRWSKLCKDGTKALVLGFALCQHSLEKLWIQRGAPLTRLYSLEEQKGFMLVQCYSKDLSQCVKRISLSILKGNQSWGVMVYPRKSPLDLKHSSDSDYGNCSHFKQTEVNMLAAANCCGQVSVGSKSTFAGTCFQVMKYQNPLLIMKAQLHCEEPCLFFSKTKHIEIRHHFIRDCYEKKLISVEKIHTDLNVADLLTKPFDGPRFNYLVVSIGMINP